MDEKLKYRLVGATVLFALAAFFLPLILDSEKYRAQLESQIPQKPTPERLENSDSPSLDSESSDLQEQGSLIINLSEEPASSESIQNDDERHADDTVQEKTAKQQESQTELEPEESVKKQIKQEHTNTDAEVAEAKPQAEQTNSKAVEKAAAQVVQENTPPKETVKAVVTPKPLPEKKAPNMTQQDFVIQIGTFSELNNAKQLVAQLRTSNYRAYTRPHNGKTRVFVGPYPDKESAEKRKKSLETIVKSSVIILPFDTNQH